MSAAAEFRAAIATSLGHAPDEIEPGRLVRFATSGRRGDTAGWAKLFDDHLAGVYGCHRSGISGVWTAKQWSPLSAAELAGRSLAIQRARQERDAQQAEQWKANRERIDFVLGECQPVTDGDPVAMYLARRHVAARPFPPCLHVHPCLAYWHDGAELGKWPAMVAPLTSPSGLVVALHRTYLTEQGQKAPVPTVKKLTGACGSLGGAAIRLSEPSAGILGVAEGIETALAARMGSGVPTVAAYSAGALAGFQWPNGLRRLVVFADADEPGRVAAEALRRRAVLAGLECAVHAPSTEGADWADVWAQGESA